VLVTTEITTQILIEIRDAIIAVKLELQDTKTELKAEIGKTNEGLAALEGKVDVLNEKVEAIGRYAKNISRRHEKAIDELRERVAKLEARRKN
jgi:phage shock protein A